MLTAAQCVTVAYSTEDGIVCPNCLGANETGDNDVKSIIEYTASEMAGYDGLTCERCDAVIVEPIAHDVVITIRAALRPGLDFETVQSALEFEIESWLDSLDSIDHVRKVDVQED